MLDKCFLLKEPSQKPVLPLPYQQLKTLHMPNPVLSSLILFLLSGPKKQISKTQMPNFLLLFHTLLKEK